MNRSESSYKGYPSLEMSGSLGGRKNNMGIRESILKSLHKPFEALDSWGQGSLSPRLFRRALLQLCGDPELQPTRQKQVDLPSRVELRRLMEFYSTGDPSPDHVHTSKIADRLVVPSRKMQRALHRVDEDRYLKSRESVDFISRDFSSKYRRGYLEEDSSSDEGNDYASEKDNEENDADTSVYYSAFCNHLLEAMLAERRTTRERADRKTKEVSSVSEWFIREFELLDSLTIQLLAMPSRQRRKTLMKLSHCLEGLAAGDNISPGYINKSV
jgi:hypothetical protein